MSARPRRWPVWVPFATTVTLVLVSLVLPQERLAMDADDVFSPWLLAVVLAVQGLTFATVGLIISRARPRHKIGWLFAGVGIFVGLYLAAERYQYYALVVRSGDLPLGEFAAWLQAWTYVPALAIVVTVLPLLFPTGRVVSPRWNWALWLAGVSFVGLAATDALAPGVIDQSTIPNPTALSPDAHDILVWTAMSTYLVSALVGFASLVARWRQADRRERQQLKLFAYAAALLPLFVVSSAISNGGQVGGAVVRVLSFALAAGAFLGLPIATAVSILRYRLYDIDLVINRTLVYAVLTATLAVAYLGGVLLLQVVLGPLTPENDLAIAGSTLAVAALFRPARSRIQSVVDRRFYRRRYDATRTLQSFTVRLRDELDLETLGADLRGVVRDTVQPAHVSLWLREIPR